MKKWPTTNFVNGVVQERKKTPTGESWFQTSSFRLTSSLSAIVFHMVHITYLLSSFKKDRYEANKNSQS